MAIVPVPTCKLHAHNYISKILGGGGPQTLLVSLFMLCSYAYHILFYAESNGVTLLSLLEKLVSHTNITHAAQIDLLNWTLKVFVLVEMRSCPCMLTFYLWFTKVTDARPEMTFPVTRNNFSFDQKWLFLAYVDVLCMYLNCLLVCNINKWHS